MQRDLRKVCIILTAALPGHGKSTLIEELIGLFNSRPDASVEIVTSDIVRQESIIQWCKSNESAHLTAYQKETNSKGLCNENMEKAIVAAFDRLKSHQGECFFILDKNFVSEELRSLVFKRAHTISTRVSSFLIVPMQSQEPDLQIKIDGVEFPLSFDSLFASLARSLNRKGHISLCHGADHTLESISKCFKSFEGVNFKETAESYGSKIIFFDYFGFQILQSRGLINNFLNIKDEVVKFVAKDRLEIGDGAVCKDFVESERFLIEVARSFDHLKEAYIGLYNRIISCL